MVTIIDGRNLIHGRLASVVAEKIMDGEEVVVLNAEAIVITGVKENVFADFKAKVDRGDTTRSIINFLPIILYIFTLFSCICFMPSVRNFLE